MARTLNTSESGAWRYFDRRKHDDGTWTSHCRLCSTSYKGRQTSNVWLHVCAKHAAHMEAEDLEKHAPALAKRRKPHRHRDKRMWRQLCRTAKWIVKDCHPISVVESEGFREMQRGVMPRHVNVSRAWMTENVIMRAFESMKSNMGAILRRQAGIGLTSDLWTSRSHRGFICFTAHYIDESFKMRSLCIQCPEVFGRHTSVNVAAHINTAASALGVRQLVQGIVTDNATNVTRAVRVDARLRSFRCMAHTLQLTLGLLEPPAMRRLNPDVERCVKDAILAQVRAGKDTVIVQPTASGETVERDATRRSKEPFMLTQAPDEERERRIAEHLRVAHLAVFVDLVERVKKVVRIVRKSTLKSSYLRNAQERYLADRGTHSGKKEEDDGTSPDAKCSAAALMKALNRPLLRPLKVVQHNATRWNSKARMLVRYVRLHRFITEAFARDSNTTDDQRDSLLSDSEVEFLKSSIAPLLTILRATDVFQRENEPTLGDVLPWMWLLQKQLSPEDGDLPMVLAVKEVLLKDVQARFKKMLEPATLVRGEMAGEPWLNSVLMVCTLLTPTWKDRGTGIESVGFAKQVLQAMAVNLCTKTQPGCPCCQDNIDPPAAKRRATTARSDDLDLFDSITEASTARKSRAQQAPSTDHIKKELERYFALDVERGVSFNVWWATNHATAPHLAYLARRYLCVPASSAASERFFSVAGNVVTALRNALLGDKAEALACMSFNLRKHPPLAKVFDTLPPPRRAASGDSSSASLGHLFRRSRSSATTD